MEYLVKFPNLQTLDLHGNKIRYLPTDMSGLKQLEQLDLSNNRFENAEK